MAVKAKRSPKPMSPKAGVKPGKRYKCGGKLYKCGGGLKRRKK